MHLGNKIIHFALDTPKNVVMITAAMTLLFGLLTIRIHVDTDQEKMLSANEFVRIFQDRTQAEFALKDTVVLGILNEKDEDGVFNPDSLNKMYVLSQFASGLSDQKDPERHVITEGVIAPDTVEYVQQAGLGQIRFEQLMKNVPETREQARLLRDNCLGKTFLKGTLISEDGKALALYFPVNRKNYAHTVSEKLREKIDDLGPGDEKYYIAGQPVAEDISGREMIFQMTGAVFFSMVLLSFLMLFFFRNPFLSIVPTMSAVVTVTITMGFLIGVGNSVYPVTSMIPVFIIPILIFNSNCILSAFFNTSQKSNDRRKTLEQVMERLFLPIFYTSLSSAVCFFFLTFSAIPPVRIFGLFATLGVLVGWVVTITLIPAGIMLMTQSALEKSIKKQGSFVLRDSSLAWNPYGWISLFVQKKPWLIIGMNVGMLLAGLVGIALIQVNDNPLKWFRQSHELRVADEVLNSHFSGLYEVNLILYGHDKEITPSQDGEWLKTKLEKRQNDFGPKFLSGLFAQVDEAISVSTDSVEVADRLSRIWESELSRMEIDDEAGFYSYSLAIDTLDNLRNREQIFKRPDVLIYLDGLQQYLMGRESVGNVLSVVDIIKRVHQEFFEGDQRRYAIPDTVNAVAQIFAAYQNSQKHDILHHLVTPDYTRANIRLYLKSGDNTIVKKLLQDVERYLLKNPPPVWLEHQWAGLSYVNTVWQNKLVREMIVLFFGSFFMVFCIMVILFRSSLWAILSMIPLMVSAIVVYGIIGFAGKDFDVPVAIYSLLVIIFGIHFAVHFLESSRTAKKEKSDWNEVLIQVYEGSGRVAIMNFLSVSVICIPFLFASLIPCQTNGFLMALILFFTGLTTFFLLPCLQIFLRGWLFKEKNKKSELKQQG